MYWDVLITMAALTSEVSSEPSSAILLRTNKKRAREKRKYIKLVVVLRSL